MLFLGVDRVDTSSRLPLRRRKAGDDIRIHDELIIVIAPEMLLGDADLDIGAGDISVVPAHSLIEEGGRSLSGGLCCHGILDIGDGRILVDDPSVISALRQHDDFTGMCRELAGKAEGVIFLAPAVNNFSRVIA